MRSTAPLCMRKGSRIWPRRVWKTGSLNITVLFYCKLSSWFLCVCVLVYMCVYKHVCTYLCVVYICVYRSPQHGALDINNTWLGFRTLEVHTGWALVLCPVFILPTLLVLTKVIHAFCETVLFLIWGRWQVGKEVLCLYNMDLNWTGGYNHI